MKPLVSINIVTFNAHIYLKKALESALGQTYSPIDIHLLDNNSSDDTVTIARSFKDERLHIHLRKENTGFAKGHNILIKKSRGEFVVLLNQDAWLDPAFVARGVEIFKKNDKLGALQPKIFRYRFDENSIVTKEGKPVIDATGLVMLKNRRIIARGQGQTDTGQFDSAQEIFGADGAVPMYRRASLEDIALTLDMHTEYFDEDFFMYKEDVDLSWRLRLYGWKIVYSPALLAYHARGSGESASTNYLDILKERRNISALAKSLSWRNQRLMQLKNEFSALYVRHSVHILLKEISSFAYILLFERYALRAVKDFFRLAPRAYQKRRIIMAQRRVDAAHVSKWFQ